MTATIEVQKFDLETMSANLERCKQCERKKTRCRPDNYTQICEEHPGEENPDSYLLYIDKLCLKETDWWMELSTKTVELVDLMKCYEAAFEKIKQPEPEESTNL